MDEIIIYLYLFIAILSGLVVILISLVLRYYKKYRGLTVENENLQKKLSEKQTKAYTAGVSQIKGEISQLLGTFKVLEEYDQILFVSAATKGPSIDLLGITNDEIHFIEMKTKGADLSPSERKVKKLIEEGKVKYKIFEVELPEGVKVREKA